MKVSWLPAAIIVGSLFLFPAIRRKENGWYDEDHPLVFLFLGSSGIGKDICNRYSNTCSKSRISSVSESVLKKDKHSS